MNFESVTSARKQVETRIFMAGSCLFFVAIIIKLSLQYFSPLWLVPLSEKIKSDPAFKYVELFSHGRPDAYVLLAFFYFSFVCLSLFSVILKARYCSLKETMYYYTIVKRMSLKKYFIAGVLMFFIICTAVYFQVVSPPQNISFPSDLFNAMYSDSYMALLISFWLLLPGCSWLLAEYSFMLTSLVLYCFSTKFRESFIRQAA